MTYAEKVRDEWCAEYVKARDERDALRSRCEKLGEALRKIAYREPWKGRDNYARDDEGLAEYWSDMAKEFQTVARDALSAASGEASEDEARIAKHNRILDEERTKAEAEGRFINGKIHPADFHPAPSEAPNAETRESIMARWDEWRRAIAAGDKSSWPRDAFESILDAYDAALDTARAEGESIGGRKQAAVTAPMMIADNKKIQQLRARIAELEKTVADMMSVNEAMSKERDSARAEGITAERERCAKIAESELVYIKDNEHYDPGALRDLARDIAAAIRSGPKP